MTTPDVSPAPPVWRRRVALLLVVVSSITVLASVIAVWAHRTLFDTDTFMETIQPVLDDPRLEAQLADYLTTEVTDALDLEERLREPLADLDSFLAAALLGLVDNERVADLLEGLDRPTLESLAGPIAARFEDRISQIVDQVLASAEEADLLPRLVRRAHEATVALLQGELDELPNVSLSGGDVRLNLLPVISTVLQRVIDELRDLLPDVSLPAVVSDNVEQGISDLRESLGDRIPDDFGQVVVMSEARLTELQTMVSAAQRWVWALLLLTVVLLVVTILVSPNRRRTAIQLASGVFLALALGFVLLGELESAVVGEIANPANEETAIDLLGKVLAGLRTGLSTILVVSALVAIGLYIWGRKDRETEETAPTSA